MDEKDIQYLALLIVQLHATIGRLEREATNLRQQNEELKKLHEAEPGREN